MNPDLRIRYRPLWDTPEFWERRERAAKLAAHKSEFRRRGRDVKRSRRQKLAVKSRRINRQRAAA